MNQAAAILGVVGTFLMAQGCAIDATESVGTTEQALECNTNVGVNPVKAALAVAMASEMGEVDPGRFLEINGEWFVGLSADGEARCNAVGGCPNLEALLALQRPEVNQYLNNQVLDATVYRSDLLASVQRQYDHTRDLEMNQPWKLPEPHRLVEIGQVDKGGCGVHYEYKAYKRYCSGDDCLLDHPENLAANLVFFGILSGNEFIDFYATDAEIAIDPTVGLNTLPNTIPICEYGAYKYDPTYASLGDCCIYGGYKQWRRLSGFPPGFLLCKS